MKKQLIKNALNLPKPAHKWGYTVAQLDSIMTDDELIKFDRWFSGQTCMYDKKLGTIIYTHDVERFLKLIRFKNPTYWD